MFEIGEHIHVFGSQCAVYLVACTRKEGLRCLRIFDREREQCENIGEGTTSVLESTSLDYDGHEVRARCEACRVYGAVILITFER